MTAILSDFGLLLLSFFVAYELVNVPWRTTIYGVYRYGLKPVVQVVWYLKWSLATTTALCAVAQATIVRLYGPQPHWLYITGLGVVLGIYTSEILRPLYKSANDRYMTLRRHEQIVDEIIAEMDAVETQLKQGSHVCEKCQFSDCSCSVLSQLKAVRH